MAKRFYSLREVQEKLGLSSEKVGQLVADRRLSEFHDGGIAIFEAEQVDKLASEGASCAREERKSHKPEGLDSETGRARKKKRLTLKRTILAILALCFLVGFLVDDAGWSFGVFVVLVSAGMVCFFVGGAASLMLKALRQKQDKYETITMPAAPARRIASGARKTAAIVCLLFFGVGAFGFFGGALMVGVSMFGRPMASIWMRLPLGTLEDVAVAGDGRIYCAIPFGARIQVYSEDGKFLRGWFVNCAGKKFDIRVDSEGLIHVFTGGHVEQHYVFDRTGRLLESAKIGSIDDMVLSEKIIRGKPQDALGNVYETRSENWRPQVVRVAPDGAESVAVWDPLYLWPVMGPLQSWLCIFLGGIAYSQLTERRKRRKRSAA